MADIKPRVRVPKTAKPGETITVKTLINHPMESGHRTDRKTGAPIPRKIINTFTARFNGQMVISADIGTAVSANPYFEFEMQVSQTGTLTLEWIDDDGSIYTAEKVITVG